jgi:hypothetical protein
MTHFIWIFTAHGKKHIQKKLAHSILAALNWDKWVDEEREVTMRWFWQPGCGTVKSHLSGHKPNNRIRISRSRHLACFLESPLTSDTTTTSSDTRTSSGHFTKYRKVLTPCCLVCRLCTVQQCSSAIQLPSDRTHGDTICHWIPNYYVPELFCTQ